MERAAVSADPCPMTVNHDPRPASRYQAVTPSAYREVTSSPERVAATVRMAASGARVLRTVPAQAFRIEAAR
jgi:hypothetical protein